MKRKHRIWGTQLLMILVVVTGLYFGYSFAREVVQAQQLANQAEAARQENDRLGAENRKIARDLQYYQSDAYAELRARTDLNMRRLNEQIVLPVLPPDEANTGTSAAPGAPSDAAPAPKPAPARPTNPDARNWDRWLALFSSPSR